jgi:hypothetical protein
MVANDCKLVEKSLKWSKTGRKLVENNQKLKLVETGRELVEH